MERRNLTGKILVSLRRQRVCTGRNTRLKEKCVIRPHFMMIGEYIRAPAVKVLHARNTFRMPQWQPVPVQVKPVVIGAPTRPGFILFQIVRIAGQVHGTPAVDPLRKALKTVRIERRIHQNNCVCQCSVYLRPLCSRQMVDIQQRSIGAAGLIAVHAVSLIQDHRHIRNILICRTVRIAQRQMLFTN